MHRAFLSLIGLGLLLVPGTVLAQEPAPVSADSATQSASPLISQPAPQPAPPPECQTLTGLITDENYQPLTGATVQVRGINDAYSTNSEGRYIIAPKNPIPSPMRLQLSAAGYESQEILLKACQPPDVALRLVPGTRFKRDGRIKKTTSTGRIK
ncbi:MAG: carboxypeptidase-like regulatory domain-containing protein [Hymenobacter sp.]|nr:carboxypeptidase-like regulatory domain-containing protein [Hymenobacter sp.]